MSKETLVALYGRTSTKTRQEVENQLFQLREYCQKNGYDIYKEFIDHESGSNPDRKAFKQLLRDAYQKKFTIVIFWALDRFSREGAKETINYLSELESYGVHFISYTEPYLNSIGIFKDAIISILATLAKQEKIRLQERIIAGIQTAKRKGIRIGRRPLPPIMTDKVKELKKQGLSIRAIAKKLKMSIGSVHKTLQNMQPESDVAA